MELRISRTRARCAGIAAFTVVASLFMGVSAAPASADEGEITADQITELIAEASPDGATTASSVETADSLEAESGGTTTAVPLDAADPISISTVVEDREVQAEISLPLAGTVGPGEVTENGTVVYPQSSSSDGAALAVQTLEGGDTRVQTILSDKNAPTEYAYGMDGYQAVIDDEGNAGFLSDSAEGLYIPVEAAWATDADGAAVETSYEVRDGALVQVIVTTDDTAFPVVADPTWGWRNAAYGLTLSRSEVAAIKDYNGAFAMCGAIALKFKQGAVVCSAYAGYILAQSATANRMSPRGCLHVVVAPVPGAILQVRC